MVKTVRGIRSETQVGRTCSPVPSVGTCAKWPLPGPYGLSYSSEGTHPSPITEASQYLERTSAG